MITIDQYVGPHAESPDWDEEKQANAEEFLAKCARLEALLVKRGVLFPNNPATGTGVSGKMFGGFRPKSCPQGAPSSSHKEGRGVDRFDPHNFIDEAIKDDYDVCVSQHKEQESLLVQCDLYIEHPNATPTWSHWTDRAPPSGRRVFVP